MADNKIPTQAEINQAYRNIANAFLPIFKDFPEPEEDEGDMYDNDESEHNTRGL